MFEKKVASIFFATCFFLLSACGSSGSSTSQSDVGAAPPLANVVGHGQFLEAQALRFISADDVSQALNAAGAAAFSATPRYGVQAFRLTYLTFDGSANKVKASALVVVPQKPQGMQSPVLLIFH